MSDDGAATGPSPTTDPPNDGKQKSDLGTLALWLAVALAIVLLAFTFLPITPLGALHVGLQFLDGALLICWGILDFSKYLKHRDDKTHLRDGSLLTALGVITIAGLAVEYFQSLPRHLAADQSSAFTEAMSAVRGSRVELQWLTIDFEANNYAEDFKGALTAAGVQVETLPAIPFGGGWTEGIYFCFEEKDVAQKRVFDAFGRAVQSAKLRGVKASPCPTKNAVLTIGTKPK